LGLPTSLSPARGERTIRAHQALVRERTRVTHDPERARAVAARAIRSAAAVKNNPADLINVALETLVKESLELPGYSALNKMASRIRGEVNSAIFELVVARMSLPDRGRLEALLEVIGPKEVSGLAASKPHDLLPEDLLEEGGVATHLVSRAREGYVRIVSGLSP
jgi:hypothetical protein